MKCGCGRQRPFNPPIIGIQCGLAEEPYLILWNCACGSTRAIKWASATEPQRAAARLAELSRDSQNEMSCWRG